MHCLTKSNKNLTDPEADILPQVIKAFDDRQNYRSGLALIPIKDFQKFVLNSNGITPLAEVEVLTKLTEQYLLVQYKKQKNNQAGFDEQTDRQLMAIFVADIAEYCRLMHADETTTVKWLNTYKRMMFKEIGLHRGYVVDSCGDNIMAAFKSAVNAVSCAVTIQDLIEKENQGLPKNKQINFRMGIHLGDVICQGQYLYGNTVNIAARLQSISDPGGIRISRAVHEQVECKLDMAFYNLGERYVKNIPHPINVYRVGNK